MIQTRYPQPYSEELYQSKLREFLSDKSDGSELFALRCQMFREQITEEVYDLLFIPVGHTHQAPILAALAAPARQTYLLCSRESWEMGAEIIESLGDEFQLKRLKINPVDGKDIADKVEAIYETQGCPARVVSDQTGGKKPTITTLASLAALNDWRLLYIESTQEQKKIHSEYPLWLPNLFDSFGGIHRLVARRCAELGALEAAQASLQMALTQAAISGPLLAEQKEIRLADLFRRGEVAKFNRALPARVWSEHKAVIEQHPEALVYWMVRCLWKQGQKLAAEGLTQRTWGHPNVERMLAEVRQRHSRAVRALKSVDQRYGLGFGLS